MRTRLMNCATIAVFWALALTTPELRTFALVNLAVQLAIFIPIANVQGWRRNQISFVDIAWPTGLMAIGIQLAIFADRLTPLTVLTAGFYVIVGARMATWATRVYRSGGLAEELPRYRYQRIRWKHEGFRSERFSIQFEITVQMLANATVLAMPAYLIATNSSASITPWEIACVVVALAAYAFESLADLQKSRFTGGYANTGTGICDVGLWRYSRHPNYFGQWVQWVALVGLALPSLADLRDDTSAVAWAGLLVYLLAAAGAMYYTLVHYTGAVPAEHYSALKRPAYAGYQATVNRFFPGPRRRHATADVTGAAAAPAARDDGVAGAVSSGSGTTGT